MSLFIIAIAVVLNVVFIKWKYDCKRYLNATVDLLLMIGVMYLFKGSFDALVVGTIASAIISIYLFFSPPRMPEFD